MNRILQLGFLALVAHPAIAQQRPNPPPPLPWERPAPCDNYCESPWTVCRSTDLYAIANPNGAPVFTLVYGDTIHVLAGKVRVERPGIVVFHDTVRYITPTDLPGPEHFPAPIPDSLIFTPGDTVFVLDWDSDGDGSGAWHIWYHGQHLAVDGFWDIPSPSGNPKAVMVSQPQAIWWVRARDAAGREAWLAVADDNVAGTAPHYRDGPELCAKK
jgi:hypothetical protein